jgi:hypothetical protein
MNKEKYLKRRRVMIVGAANWEKNTKRRRVMTVGAKQEKNTKRGWWQHV